MVQCIEVLTAGTRRGRLAITEVMHRSYAAEIDSVPPLWARVLVVDNVPVSFILVDPNRWMEHLLIYSSLETPFTALARACGAQVCVHGADPEAGSIPDADWIKVLDTAVLLREALQGLGNSPQALPVETICFDTGAGAAIIESVGGDAMVSDGVKPDTVRVKWPSSALAQLVTGYQPAEVLSVIHNTPLPAETMAFLRTLFARRWRLSRNESWTFKS